MRPRLSPPPRTVPSPLRTITAIWAAHPARRITGPWRIENQAEPQIRTTQRIMNLLISKAIVALVLGMAITAQAGVYSYGGGGCAVPPRPLSFLSSQITISGASSSFSDISVAINVSGGYN